MKLTLKEELNTKSLVLRHEILIEATTLLLGREGALETEKDLYLMMAMVDNLVNENVIELCNDDERELLDIAAEDIEPFFLSLCEKAEYQDLYDYLHKTLVAKMKADWDNQHNIVGVIDAMLTMIGSMDEESKKEALVATGKMAEAAFDRRTEKMEQATKETNSKLEELVKQYERQSQEKLKQQKENKEETTIEE